MRIELGNPQTGAKIVFDVDEQMTDEQIEVLTVQGLCALKVAGDAWRDWSLENETPEQKEVRLEMERHALLQRQVVSRQNAEMEQMLNGQPRMDVPKGKWR